MMTRPLSLIAQLAALVAIAGCAHATKQTEEGQLATGEHTVNHCQPNEMLVVENRTGFPVRVGTNDGGPNAFLTGGGVIATVGTGVVDTIPGSQLKSQPKIAYRVERPDFSNGMRLPVSGLRSWCATAE